MKKILIITGMAALLLMLPACATFTTKLGTAARTGDIGQVETLLRTGADVNETVDLGMTPLYEAVRYNAPADIVRLLIDNGADVNQGLHNGWKPIHVAVFNGNERLVKLLLDRGANTSFVNAQGKTPLQMAQARGQTNIIRLLQDAEERQYKTLYADGKNAGSPGATITSDAGQYSAGADLFPTIHATQKKKSAYAIVIGIETYRQKLPTADYAVRDARMVADYLSKTMGYPEENIVMLLDDYATRSDMEKYFAKWLANNVEKDGSVFIYYSGHGAPDPKTGDAFLVPYDGDPSFIKETGYSLKRLYAMLDHLPAKEIIVALDSCFSGAGGRSVLAKGARPLVMSRDVMPRISPRLAVLSASSASQISSTYEEKGHGLFTYFMLRGLRGEADGNTDGAITIAELYEYTRPNVKRVARKNYNNEQTPQLNASEALKQQKIVETE